MTTYQNGFSALADPTRRAIFERLARGPHAVGELADEFPVSRPAVSQHLRVLKDAGLVADRREGNRRLYRVDPRGVGGNARLPRLVLERCARRLPKGRRAEGSNMTDQATIEAARQSVTVPLTPERAYDLFVDEFDSWWPKGSHTVADATGVVLEAREGGRWGELDAQGEFSPWGSVLAAQRPDRILLAWQLDPDFKFDPDTARRTEVEVTFTAEGESSTLVDAGAPRLRRVGRARRRDARFRQLRGRLDGAAERIRRADAALTQGESLVTALACWASRG